MPYIHSAFARIIRSLILPSIMLTVMAGCGTSAPDDVDSSLDEINSLMAFGDYDHAQKLCDNVLTLITDTDSSAVTETQGGTLGIMYMKLSEQRNEDENVGNATICIRYAYRISADSLKEFAASLPFEDERHFELLRRIGLMIDNPVDLSEEEPMHDGEEDTPDVFGHAEQR